MTSEGQEFAAAQKRFCLRGLHTVSADDLGAVELENNVGIICGADVDAMIASIHVPREYAPTAPLPARLRPTFKLPGEPRGEYL